MPGPWARGIRVRIIGHIHGQLTVNVLHFGTHEVVSDPPAINALLLQLATAVAACIIDNFLPAATSDWSLARVEAQEIAPTLSDPVVFTPEDPAVGTAGVASASFLASLVQIFTGGGGRSGRGRIFLPPAGEAQTANSLLDAGTMTAIAAFLACVAGKFIGVGATEPFALGVLSQKTFQNTPANFDAAFREATQLVPSNVVAIMGTRKVGRGA